MMQRDKAPHFPMSPSPTVLHPLLKVNLFNIRIFKNILPFCLRFKSSSQFQLVPHRSSPFAHPSLRPSVCLLLDSSAHVVTLPLHILFVDVLVVSGDAMLITCRCPPPPVQKMQALDQSTQYYLTFRPSLTTPWPLNRIEDLLSGVS